MPGIDVDALAEEANFLKGEIAQLQKDAEIIHQKIKRNRDRLKVLNPLIVLYDGEAVELPELDLRRVNGIKRPKAESEPKPRRQSKKKKAEQIQFGHIGTTENPAPKWPVYPEYCLLATEFHRSGQRRDHIGKGLCNAHVQRLRMGALTADELEAYKKAAQEWADQNDFELP